MEGEGSWELCGVDKGQWLEDEDEVLDDTLSDLHFWSE